MRERERDRERERIHVERQWKSGGENILLMKTDVIMKRVTKKTKNGRQRQ